MSGIEAGISSKSRYAMNQEMLQMTADTIRFLAVDGVQKAKSGHPGMPMGTADIAVVLWNHFLYFNPEKPLWINRDRFVLSAGHGSMLLYSLLHLFGFNVTMDDLKSFRQWRSRTPGHPEKGLLPGVECTTGPLGQGFGMGVGMALAQKVMADRFNTGDFKVFNHRIYAIVSDGDLMEGVASEAASFAGHHALDNIIYIYDCNRITIEGATNLTFTEDVRARFLAYGWEVFTMEGHDQKEIYDTLTKAAASDSGCPRLIIAHTHIAKGSPHMQDNAEAHGAPLGADEVMATKKALNWPLEPEFYVPQEVSDFCGRRVKELTEYYQEWENGFASWREKNPEKASLLDIYLEKKIPDELEAALLESIADKDVATRVSSGEAIQKIGSIVPFTIGGAADLEPSIKCHIKSSSSIAPHKYAGRNIHFGVREHGMGAIINGIALYGGLIPWGGTFLIFSDYMKPAIRLAAIMEVQVIFIFTHDSVFLGEDGPTHEPVEQLGTLRSVPNLETFRPADGAETAISWLYALKRKAAPTAIVLTRQNVPQLRRSQASPHLILKGGYILEDSERAQPDLIIIATGSEVHLAQGAKTLLSRENIDARVISMPSLGVFQRQEEDYRKAVIPDGFEKIVVIEASNSRDFDRYLGVSGLRIGISRYGASAPWKVIAENLGFTSEKVTEKILDWLQQGHA